MPKSQRLLMDGKNWTFAPGKNGSLTSDPEPFTPGFDISNSPPKAKSIVSPALAEEASKKNRKNLVRSLIALGGK